MWKKLLLGIVVVIAGILLYAATRPDTFRVERTVTIKAPPDKVYALVNDLHAWQQWSPWEKLDPAMHSTFSGPAAGKGAAYAWKGNSNVGEGRMEIIDTTPPSQVLIKLDFIEPIKSENTTDLTMKPTADGTTVVWSMYGPMPYLSKLVGLFASMDRMIGKDFEKGLATLKASAEK